MQQQVSASSQQADEQQDDEQGDIATPYEPENADNDLEDSMTSIGTNEDSLSAAMKQCNVSADKCEVHEEELQDSTLNPDVTGISSIAGQSMFTVPGQQMMDHSTYVNVTGDSSVTNVQENVGLPTTEVHENVDGGNAGD